MDPSQTERLATVTSTLGKDVLLFRRMKAHEALGRMFRFDLELVSKESDIKFEDAIGQPMTVELQLGGDKSRFFSGLVTRFAQVGTSGRLAKYEVTLRPWLWFLTRTSDCRIFPKKEEAKKMSAPKIIMEVFREHGFTDFEDHLQESYKDREHCVQYRESDYDFVMRLMEDEGIYFYFRHEKDKHFLVLCDSYSSHDKISGYEKVPYFPRGNKEARERDHLFEWNICKTVQTGICALSDFDFELPKKNLEVKSSVGREHSHSKFEAYDYPGGYVDPADGEKDGKQNDKDLKEAYEKFAKTRIEERQARHEELRGAGNARGLTAGALFELTDHPRKDQGGREYLIVSVSHDVRGDDFASGGGEGEGGEPYSCSIKAIDAKQPYRPARVTAKPVIRGPQTAIVVGKQGEEIWTDQYGRVRVQFHWDRYGESDEKSSCWVRVAQAWAGKQWGGIHIPRMGQEVIVEYLEGDPDRPIITGSVYNGDNLPPYELPANQTQSGIKTRSTKEGTDENFNEIRFEDLKGEEQVFIHAEKNQDLEVENDETHWVGHDRTKKVDNDETITIGNDKAVDVANNHKETVGGTQTVTVKKSRTDSVSENEERTVSGNRTRSVGKDETISIAATQKVSVDKNRSAAIAKDDGLSVGGNLATSVSKNAETTVTNNYSLDAKKIVIEAGTEISLKTGSASIVMKKNGDITINGKKINIKGSGDVIIKGSKIAEN